MTTLQDIPDGETLPGPRATPAPPVPAAPPRQAILAAAAILLALLLAGGAYLLRRPTEPVSVAVLEPVVQGPSQGALDLLPSAVHAAVVRGLLGLEGISPKTSDEVDAVSGNPVQVASVRLETRRFTDVLVVAQRLEMKFPAIVISFPGPLVAPTGQRQS